MKSIKEALVAIRAIATNWLSDQTTDGATAMSEVTVVLLNTRFNEPEQTALPATGEPADTLGCQEDSHGITGGASPSESGKHRAHER